jgi:hypothetical protein
VIFTRKLLDGFARKLTDFVNSSSDALLTRHKAPPGPRGKMKHTSIACASVSLISIAGYRLVMTISFGW